MAEHRSAEQVLEQHIRDMGTDLGTLYNVLTNEVAWVHAKWTQYQQLYAHSPERITLLNETAGHFFGIIQDALFEDVILHLARLTDPPQSMRKHNLTLCRLPPLISHTQLRAGVTDLVKTAQAACESVREWRNRR